MAHSLLADISSLVLTLLKFLWDFTVNLEVRKICRKSFPLLSFTSSMQGQCLPIEMANRLEKVQQVRKNLLNAAAGSLSKLPLSSTNVPAVLLPTITSTAPLHQCSYLSPYFCCYPCLVLADNQSTLPLFYSNNSSNLCCLPQWGRMTCPVTRAKRGLKRALRSWFSFDGT